MAGMTNTGLPYSAVDQGPPMPNGWLLFSGLMILLAGIFNIFEGLTGLFRSSFFFPHTLGGPLWIWAILWIVFGLVQMAASGAIMSHRSWGRWFGIVTVGLSLLVNLLVVGAYPWWSIVIIAIEILVLFGLTVQWQRPGQASV